jgi:D-alanyl-D-alanine dipeptidase
MNALEYCEDVERKDRLLKRLIPTIPIRDNNSPLISLKDAGFNLMYEPSIMKDYKYRVREEIIEKVGRISKLLDREDKVLSIRSAWRSFEHQELLWEYYRNRARDEDHDRQPEETAEIASKFIASPKTSMHSTGGAIDVLIYDLKEDRVMDFGTNDGYRIVLDERCYPLHPDISASARENRKLLMGLFENEGFVCDLREYWHFDYGNVVWAIGKKESRAIYGIIES